MEGILMKNIDILKKEISFYTEKLTEKELEILRKVALNLSRRKQ